MENTLSARAGRRRPNQVGYFAAVWAGCYGLLALTWTVTGHGYPYGHNDAAGRSSLLWSLPATVGAPIFAGVMLTAAVVLLAMAGRRAVRLRGVPRVLLLAYGWLVAAALLIVVPDMQVLALTGYAPMLVLSLPFGGLGVDYSTIFTWALFNKCLAVAGGLLIARAVFVWQARTGGLCVSCGRGGGAGWSSPEAAARWGRWATYVAAVIPVTYAVSRLSWLLGIPLGVSEEFFRDLHADGRHWAGAGLAAFGLVGSVLTLGLVQGWGERFPRWLPGLAGRSVPVMLVVVPATLVAVAVAAASLPGFFSAELWQMGFGAGAPLLLWPVWAVALASAALAYYLRRRGACRHCGQP